MPIEVSRIRELMADSPPGPHADLSASQTASRAMRQMLGLAWSQMGGQMASLAASQVATAMKSLQETRRTQEEDDRSILGPTLALGVSEHARAEAEARRATSELRALALQHRDALQQVRQESEAAARRYYWKGLASGVLITRCSLSRAGC